MMLNNESRPYWMAEETNHDWCDAIREDYPAESHLPDDEIRERYAKGRKYQVLWDHLGEAYDDYEKLLDAYLELKARMNGLEK